MDYNKRAAQIIDQILYITIASVTPQGEPWNSPVYSAFDKDLNFYWCSDKNGQHSQNVRHNGKAFLVIYDSTVPEGQGEGVYLQVDVTELTEADQIQYGYQTLQARKNKQPADDAWQKFTGDGVRRIYQAKPTRAWMNDAEMDGHTFIRDIRVELVLDDVKSALSAV